MTSTGYKILLLGILLLGIAGSVAICDETPKYGGTLVFLQSEDPGTLDIAMEQATTEASVVFNVVEHLAVVDPKTLQVAPWLAESWEDRDNGTTWDIHLRKGVKFHNGETMTAAVVKWSLDYANDPKFARTYKLLEAVDSVEVMDEYTIRVNLNAPNRIFPASLTEFWVLPTDPGIDHSTHPVGTGPFKFVEWNRAQYIKLEKFDEYWQDGLPYLDGILFKFVPDLDVQLIQLQTGESDFMMNPSFAQIAQFEANDQLQLVYPPVSTNAYILMPNTKEGPTSDFRVRQAIAYALDREKANQVLQGLMPILPSTTIPRDHALYNPSAPEYLPRDVEKAKELLTEAGYPDGLSIEFGYFTVAKQYELLAPVIQASLAEAGIKLEMQQMEIAMYVDKFYNARDYELGLTATSLKPEAFDMISHTYAEVNGHAMFIDETYPEIYELLTAAKGAPSEEAYNQVLRDLQMVIAIKQPCIAIGNFVNLSGARANVKGYLQQPRPGRFFFYRTWLDE